MGAAAGQSNDRWSSCADGYYQANDNDTNVNDDDKRNNNDNPMADKGTVQMASTASSNMQQSFFNRWESKNRLKALYNRTFCCPRDIISLAGLPSTLQRGHRAQTFSRRKVKSCEQHVGHP